MTSLILSTAARYLLPLLMLFSLFVLLRGHNEPGGGFIGGLVAAGRGERRPDGLYVIAIGFGVAVLLAALAPTQTLERLAMVVVGGPKDDPGGDQSRT